MAVSNLSVKELPYAAGAALGREAKFAVVASRRVTALKRIK
jgi:hypothetical protein